MKQLLSTLLLHVNKPLWDLPAFVLWVIDLHMQPLICFHGNINSERGDVGTIHCLITGCKCQLGVGEKVHWYTSLSNTHSHSYRILHIDHLMLKRKAHLKRTLSMV